MSDEITPEQARDYIATFRKHVVPGMDWVKTNSREIRLDDMTDEEAVFVAGEFARMEAEAAKLSAKRRRPN